jgi:short-subunit dehydrogenase
MKNQKSVLITGTSSGIGEACTVHLAKKGFVVYAGVRKNADLEMWNKKAIENIRPILLDVTKTDQIESAKSLISGDNNSMLYGIINNAGAGISGVVEATPTEEFRKILEINILGMHEITRTFLPLLRKNKGRIINIGSTASFFAGPGSSAYTASKFAVRGYTDCLRIEVAPFGMHVALIAPGAIESKIWEKSAEYKKKLREKTSDELKEAYKMFILASNKMIEKIKPIPAINVAKAVEYALLSKKPKFTYLVGSDAKNAFFASKFPKKLVLKRMLQHIEKLSKE